MDIILSKLYKVDVANNEATERPEYHEKENFKIYIQNLLTYISERNPEREYKFKSGATEVKTLSNAIIINHEDAESSQAIANRLLDKEKDAQADLNRKKLKKDIQKGMLIVAFVRMTDYARKLIISKVDYDEFISELTGEIVSGISTKRKVYKALVCEIDNGNNIISTLVFDTNTPVSAYWWKNFLELDVVTNDDENTQRAFDAIEKNILNPLKAKYKTDYFHIWNSTILYFRSSEEFSIEGYLSHIGDYTPYDETLNMDNFRQNVRDLPTKAKNQFDSRFTIVKNKIKKRLKNTIKLTDQIDLQIKQDIPNPENTIRAVLGDDLVTKYVMIKSAEGYDYFKRHLNDINND